MNSIQIDDNAIAYVDRGEGLPFVFLHGFPLTHAMWNAQIDEFASSHRVIAPDLRGHGASSVTVGTVSMREMADDVAKLLDALHVTTPVVLCGLSMGGYVAFEFWRRHASRLSKLILCSTRAVADTDEIARARQMMAAQVVISGAQMAVDSMLPKLFGKETQERRAETIDAVRQTILSTSPETIAATQRGMAQRADMTPMLPQIETPALVLCGVDDTISTPSEMCEFAALMPNSSYLEIERAGHLAPLEQPEQVNGALREFLGA